MESMVLFMIATVSDVLFDVKFMPLCASLVLVLPIIPGNKPTEFIELLITEKLCPSVLPSSPFLLQYFMVLFCTTKSFALLW